MDHASPLPNANGQGRPPAVRPDQPVTNADLFHVLTVADLFIFAARSTAMAPAAHRIEKHLSAIGSGHRHHSKLPAFAALEQVVEAAWDLTPLDSDRPLPPKLLQAFDTVLTKIDTLAAEVCLPSYEEKIPPLGTILAPASWNEKWFRLEPEFHALRRIVTANASRQGLWQQSPPLDAPRHGRQPPAPR